MTEHEEARDLERAFAEVQAKLEAQAAEPFDPESEILLGRIPLQLSTELRRVLRKTPTAIGQMNPQGLAPAARQMLLLSVADVCAARTSAGMTTNSIADLGMPRTINAIQARLGPSTVTPITGRWGPIKGGMLLADVRKLVIFVHGSCDAEIGRQQRQWSSQPKRSINHRVCSEEEYLAGACAIGAIARILQADGRVRGDKLARDSALLAFDTCVYARHGELHRANVEDFRKRTVNEKPVLSFTVRITKTNSERIVLISNPRVIEIVTPLLEADGNAPLFREEGRRLDYSSIENIIRRIGVLATGQPATANLIRRSAALRRDGKDASVGRKLGQRGERTADDHYTPDCTKLALELLNAANDKPARIVAKFRDRSCSRQSHDPPFQSILQYTPAPAE